MAHRTGSRKSILHEIFERGEEMEALRARARKLRIKPNTLANWASVWRHGSRAKPVSVAQTDRVAAI
jgi:transposase-like protein